MTLNAERLLCLPYSVLTTCWMREGDGLVKYIVPVAELVFTELCSRFVQHYSKYVKLRRTKSEDSMITWFTYLPEFLWVWLTDGDLYSMTLEPSLPSLWSQMYHILLITSITNESTYFNDPNTYGIPYVTPDMGAFNRDWSLHSQVIQNLVDKKKKKKRISSRELSSQSNYDVEETSKFLLFQKFIQWTEVNRDTCHLHNPYLLVNSIGMHVVPEVDIRYVVQY